MSNLRRDFPLSASDLQRFHERHALVLALLGVFASLVRLHKAAVTR